MKKMDNHITTDQKLDRTISSVWFDIVLLLIALICLIFVIPTGIQVQDNQLGLTPRSFPYISMTIMAICCIYLILFTLFRKRTAIVSFHSGYIRNTLFPIFLFAVYINMMEKIGFFISTALALIVFLVLMGNKSLLRIIMTSICTVIVLYSLLHYGLMVDFPSGTWFR